MKQTSPDSSVELLLRLLTPELRLVLTIFGSGESGVGREGVGPYKAKITQGELIDDDERSVTGSNVMGLAGHNNNNNNNNRYVIYSLVRVGQSTPSLHLP